MNIMRKSILFLMLCLVILSMPMLNALAASSDNDTTEISGNVIGAIEITAPADISGWELDPSITQPNTQTGTLHVKANKGWQVTASDEDMNTNGHMTEWDGSNYGERKLSNPMKVSAEVEVTLPTGGVIQKGEETGSGGMDITVTFKQTVTWDDDAYVKTYRIVVTFTGSLIV